ncbi:MAG TPA: hypothetical protein VHA75_20320, partial [Rugosimonospora sp.]|nr:hypothetical protein [Rugosimonospora sp.]
NTATADYYQEPDYATAATALEALAVGSCEGTLTVVKQIVLPGGSITDPDTVVAGPGWQITASGDVPAATQTTTTDETGAVQFPLTGTAGTGLTINVTEAQHSGYTRIPANLAGEPADCMAKTSTGASLPLPAVDFGGGGPGNPGFTITGVPPDGVTTCTIYDQAPVGTTTVVVDKEWVVNGGAPIPHNERPSGLDAQLGLTAPGGGPLDTPEWGHVYSEYTAGTQVSISESSTTVDLPGCSQASVPVVSGPDGVPNPLQPSHEVTLDADPDLNVFTVTNFVTCTTRLTLRKEVAGGGPAAATDWTLSATPQAPGSLPGFSGATGTAGVTGQPVSAEAVYVLAESGGDPRYAQDDIRQSPFVPGTTGSWVCNLLQNANQPGIIDGTDGVVAVPLGSHVVCTATNRVTELGLVKNVTNDNGGTAVPSDWTLTLTPTGNVPAGLEPVTVPGSATPVPILVRPGTTYTVSESGPPAYTLTSLACDPPGILTGPRDVLLGPDIPPEAGATCTVTNDDPAPPPPAPPTLPATGPLTPRLAELGLLLVGLGLACLLAGRRPRPVDAASGS